MTKKKPTRPIVTDAVRTLVSLPPVLAEKIDLARGVTNERPDGLKTLPAQILEDLAKVHNVKAFHARGRGRPKKSAE